MKKKITQTGTNTFAFTYKGNDYEVRITIDGWRIFKNGYRTTYVRKNLWLVFDYIEKKYGCKYER